MNKLEHTPKSPFAASPASHAIDYAALRALPAQHLEALWEVASEAESLMMAHLNADRFGHEGGCILEDLEMHLATFAEAVAVAAEKRAPRDPAEAEARARLLLKAALRNGATLPDLAELRERVSADRGAGLT